MAQDTIRCYDSPSDVAVSYTHLTLQKISLPSPMKKSVARKRVSLVSQVVLL